MSEKTTTERAKQYQRWKKLMVIFYIVIGFLFLAVMVGWGSRPLREYLHQVTSNNSGLVALFVFAFVTIYDIVTLPLNLFNGYVLEHEYQLSNETLGSWVKDEVKKYILSLVLLIPLVEIIYVFLRHFPGTWWLFSAAVWILFTIVLSKLAPVVILPLFYKTTPLDDEELKEQLSETARKGGLEVSGIFKLDLSRTTKKANAALAGLGKTRRIILGDTLLDHFEPDEIEIVFAHEIGHHVYKHIGKLLIIGSVASIIGMYLAAKIFETAITPLGFNGVSDIAAFPLLCLILSCFSIVMLPFQNLFSRKLERDSDRYALEATGKPAAFISSMEKLAQQNLADRSPGRFTEIMLYDHPPIDKRIAMGKVFLQSHPETAGKNN